MQYMYTERAHLMCPQMYFGIVETVNRRLETEALYEAFRKLSDAHPFLRALLGYEQEGNRYYYDITDASKIDIRIEPEELSAIESPVVFMAYQEETARDWDLFREGMLKAVCWKTADKTCILFIFHHLLADGRAALGLAAEFAQCYVHGQSGEYVEERLIASAQELPTGSRLPWISRLLIGKCNRDWNKEGQRVAYETYHAFANDFLSRDTVSRSVRKYSGGETQSLLESCRKNGVTVNDWLLARMFVEEKTNQIIIAQDIRGHFGSYKKGALGNYSTALSIPYRAESRNIWAEAGRVHKIVQKRTGNVRTAMMVLACYAQMDPGLLDAAAISALGGFQSRAGAFVGGNMFGYKRRDGYSITNLGRIENEAVGEAMFIPPASPAMKKTLGALTVNGQMVLCVSERK